MPKKTDADVPNYIVQGELIEKLPGALYNVKIADGTVLVCHISGAVRRRSAMIARVLCRPFIA